MSLAEHLKTDLKRVSGYPMYSWLQGSYKFATQLRPLSHSEEFDIDLGIYFHWQGKPDDGKFSPLSLKTMVQESLERYVVTQSDIKSVASPKTRCNRVHYEGNFHIDTPTYHLDSTRDARALATQEDKWEYSDPKAIYLWFKEQVPENIRPLIRRLIRYLKAWAILNIEEGSGRPSAILLTVLVVESYKELNDTETSSEDEALAGIVRLILARLNQNQKVFNPVDSVELLSARLGSEGLLLFIKHLQQFDDIAKRAIGADTQIQAVAHWIEIYQHFFPLVETELIELSEPRKDSQIVPVFTPDVYVEAKRKKQIPQRINQWSGYNRIGPIPRDCSLTFKLTNAKQLPYGARVEWTVRNEGIEAEGINDLGHLAGVKETVEERSAYKGSHYMDCIVRQWNQVIAIRRIKVIIT